jgi:hypothetical protein
MVVYRCDLGAPLARGGTLLAEPPAFGADAALRQPIDGRGQYLHDTRRQAAVGAIEVRASTCLARRRQAENLGRMKRSRHSEHVRRGGQEFIEIGDLPAIGGLLNDAEHAGTVYARL